MGDRTIAQATSTELENYGCPVGYTNYAACYATGLLIARRCLTTVGMADAIKGVEECTAEEFHVEEEDNERRPFKACFDVGLTRTISGSRIFGVLKGAVDGGLHVPHSVKNFPGYKEPEEKGMDYEYDHAAHLERILGAHVQEYMEMLQEEDPEKYKVQFAKYIENDIEPDGLEELYKSTHAQIRENPVYKKKEFPEPVVNTRRGNIIKTNKGTEYTRLQKRSYKQRHDTVRQKKMTAAKKLMAGAGSESEAE